MPYSSGRMLASKTVSTHEGTSPGDQVPSCELPILVKKCSRRDQNLVPATSPRIQTGLSFSGPFLETPDNFSGSKTTIGAQYSPIAIQFLLILKAKF